MTGIKTISIKFKWAGNILQIFNNLKISTKLVGGFSIVLFLIVCVIGFDYSTIKTTTKNFKNLMDINVKMADEAGEIKTLMKQCRIDEKSFLSTLDKKYLGQLESNIKSLKEKTQSIVTMANRAHSDTTAEVASKISIHVEKYDTSFKDLVSAYDKRGLDINSGLRGVLAEAAKLFVREMSYIDVEDIYVHMLKIFQLQNEFMRTKNPEFQAKLVRTVSEYDQVISQSVADEIVVKGTVTDVLTDYRKSLNKMVSAKTWEQKSKLLEDMLEIFEEINEALISTYLPNSKAFILKVRSNEKDYLLFGGEAYIKKVHEAIANFTIAIDKSNIDEDYLKNSHKYINQYKKAFDNLTAEDKRISDLYAIMSNEVADIEMNGDILYNEARSLSSARTKKVNTQAGKRSNLALTMGLLSIFLGIALSLFITRQITEPIIRAVGFSEKMSKGNFKSRLDIDQKDEIGILASALNGIVTSLGGMFRDIANDVNVLSSSSENLRNISEQMAKGAGDTASKSNTVSSAAEEMNANLSSVAAAMEETSVNLNSVAAATEENTATISEIAVSSDQAKNISNEAVDQAKNAAGDMEQLGNAAEDIGTVTETITKISQQTNLLALNATIEAARAGEAGRGFAVVANEIKELAQQTAEATQEIKSRITGIQSTSTSTIKGIEKITTIIDEVNEIISRIATTIGEQSTATQEIGGNIAQASLGIQEVNENIAQCSTVAGEITKDIAGVNQEAGEMSNSSSQLNTSAEDLTGLAAKLKQMLDQFEV